MFLQRRAAITGNKNPSLSFISNNQSSYANVPSFTTTSLSDGDYIEIEFRSIGAYQGAVFCRFLGSVSGSGQIHAKGDGLGFEFYWDSGSFSSFATSNFWDGEWHTFKIEKSGASVLYTLDGNLITSDSSNSLTQIERLRFSSLASKPACTLGFRNVKHFIGGQFVHDLPINDGSGSTIKDIGTTPQDGTIIGVEGVDYEWA